MDPVDFRVHIPCYHWHWFSQLLYLLYCHFTYSYLWVWLYVRMCLLTCSSTQYINRPPVVGKREYVEFLKNTFTLNPGSPWTQEPSFSSECWYYRLVPHIQLQIWLYLDLLIPQAFNHGQLNNFWIPGCICISVYPIPNLLFYFPFWDKGSVCNPDWPDLLQSSCLCYPCAGITGNSLCASKTRYL